jgi:hypothetical protein
MKRRTRLLPALVILSLCLSGLSLAQELPYKEGTVWQISFVKTKEGLELDYLRNLQTGWKRLMEEAKKEGLVLSYRVFSSDAANKEDWDLMLMVESKNMAALDGIDTKFRAIATKIIGPEEDQKKGAISRNDIREILGTKLVRELVLK